MHPSILKEEIKALVLCKMHCVQMGYRKWKDTTIPAMHSWVGKGLIMMIGLVFLFDYNNVRLIDAWNPWIQTKVDPEDNYAVSAHVLLMKQNH